jgi:hypothetical protein
MVHTIVTVRGHPKSRSSYPETGLTTGPDSLPKSLSIVER